MESRAAAFLALVDWQQKGTFLWDHLQKWKTTVLPSKSDLNFAYELACGTMRRQRYLDTLARQLCKLPRKANERMLLRLGLYQKVFCQNIPLYAVVDSMVELANRYSYKAFSGFLNAVLRKELLYRDMTIAEQHSYPDFFVQELIYQYGQESAISILERGNEPCPITTVAYGNESYIQNLTQVELTKKMAARLNFSPKTILDLCAAPGGKTLLLHQQFPEANLVCNDVTAEKLDLLKENLKRFSVCAQTCCQDGKTFTWHEKFDLILFDLILVDAPCSNSGVLYKCPEARWRLEQKEIERLQETQVSLLLAAAKNLRPGGKIFYQTCSILAQEHQEVIARTGLQLDGEALLQLPDKEGHEGGFACCLC